MKRARSILTVRPRALPAVGIAVSVFFALKLVLGMVILVVAARSLPVAGFAVFSQLLVLLAFLVTLATGGVQHGIIRQVAVAGQDGEGAVYSVIRAGLALWGGVGIMLVIAAAALAGRLSVLLIGSSVVAGAIPVMAGLAVATGLGTLLCAVLTGQGRPAASLVAQGLGLVMATSLALFFLVRRQPVGAAIGFAAGPLLTTSCALVLVGRPIAKCMRFGRHLDRSVRQLLSFSGAFLATAAMMPLTLLALRSVYRETFGMEFLGYWLAANRVSDVNTQLLGLYMTQEYLPRAASAIDWQERRTLVTRTLFITSGAMLLGLGVFSTAPALWITLFLSAKFVPAAGLIEGFFVGDFFRVAASLAAYTALAHKRLWIYVSLEALAASCMAFFVLTATALGVPGGPAMAYVATYGIIAVAAALYYWHAGRPRANAATVTGLPSEPAVTAAGRERGR